MSLLFFTTILHNYFSQLTDSLVTYKHTTQSIDYNSKNHNINIDLLHESDPRIFIFYISTVFYD